MDQSKIKVFIFTYSHDASCIIECVRSLRKSLPFSDIYVIDDNSSPIDILTRAKMLHYRIIYKKSIFNRGGNLRGKKCIEGILSCMIEFSHIDDIILKVDSDTVVLCADFLNTFENKGCMFAASGTPYQLAFGCCYAMRGSAARNVLFKIRDSDISESAPEDIKIAEFIRHLYGENALKIESPWLPGNRAGRMTAYNWQSLTATPESYSKFDVVTVGNFRPAEHPLTRNKVMQEIIEAREKISRGG